jgi:hypothetical protein
MFTISLLTGPTCYLGQEDTKVLCSPVRSWFTMQTEIHRQPVIDAGAKRYMRTLHDTQKRTAFGQTQNGTLSSANITSYGSFIASTPRPVIGMSKTYHLS